MYTKKPILQGNSELHQIELIAKLCGTPTEVTMPGVSSLAEFGKLKLEDFPRSIKSTFESMYIVYEPFNNPCIHIFFVPSIDEQGVDLIDKLLVLDPAKRLNALDALEHDYFWKAPDRAKPEDLPSYASVHEYSRRKLKQIQYQKSKGIGGAAAAASYASAVRSGGGSHSGAFSGSKNTIGNLSNYGSIPPPPPPARLPTAAGRHQSYQASSALSLSHSPHQHQHQHHNQHRSSAIIPGPPPPSRPRSVTNPTHHNHHHHQHHRSEYPPPPPPPPVGNQRQNFASPDLSQHRGPKPIIERSSSSSMGDLYGSNGSGMARQSGNGRTNLPPPPPPSSKGAKGSGSLNYGSRSNGDSSSSNSKRDRSASDSSSQIKRVKRE
jgi:hypothetical protein